MISNEIRTHVALDGHNRLVAISEDYEVKASCSTLDFALQSYKKCNDSI